MGSSFSWSRHLQRRREQRERAQERQWVARGKSSSGRGRSSLSRLGRQLEHQRLHQWERQGGRRGPRGRGRASGGAEASVAHWWVLLSSPATLHIPNQSVLLSQEHNERFAGLFDVFLKDRGTLPLFHPHLAAQLCIIERLAVSRQRSQTSRGRRKRGERRGGDAECCHNTVHAEEEHAGEKKTKPDPLKSFPAPILSRSLAQLCGQKNHST